MKIFLSTPAIAKHPDTLKMEIIQKTPLFLLTRGNVLLDQQIRVIAKSK